MDNELIMEGKIALEKCDVCGQWWPSRRLCTTEMSLVLKCPECYRKGKP